MLAMFQWRIKINRTFLKDGIIGLRMTHGTIKPDRIRQ